MNMKIETTKCCLTEKEAAIYIGMSRSYLRQDRMRDVKPNHIPGPPYVKLGRTIRYMQQDLDQWILEHRVEHYSKSCKD